MNVDEGRRRGPHVAGPRWFIDGWEDSPFDPVPESDEGAVSGITNENYWLWALKQLSK